MVVCISILLSVVAYIYTDDETNNNVLAGGGGAVISLSLEKTQATADGNDYITMTVFSFNYNCKGYSDSNNCYVEDPADCQEYSDPSYEIVPSNSSEYFRIEVSGSGNSISQPGEFMTRRDTDGGKAYVTLKSSVAEQKTITLYNRSQAHDDPSFPERVVTTKTVEFVTSNSNSAYNIESKATSTSKSKPSAPIIAVINNQNLPESKTLTQTIRAGNPIIFSGTAEADAIIKLYIYSDDPITAETQADGDGNWSYTLTDELAIGDHRVEAETVDASGTTSDRVEIAAFSIKEKIAPIELEGNTQPSYLFLTPLTIGLASGALLLLVVLIYLIIKRRKNPATACNGEKNT